MPRNNINEDLKRAVIETDVERVKALLSAGADANIQIRGRSLLHSTCSTEIANEILLYGAEIDMKDLSGKTPLCHAIQNNMEVELIKVLLHHGAQINTRNNSGESLLHCATRHSKSIELIGVLLELGADINAVDERGDTPLFCAIKEDRSMELIGELLQQGSNINARNKFDNTPLHYAVQYKKDIKLIKILLQQGADVNAVNKMGDAPVHSAIKYDMKSEFRVLTKAALIKCHDAFNRIIDDLYYSNSNVCLAQFVEDCLYEILRMHTEMVSEDFSLYDFVIMNNATIRLNLGNTVLNRIILMNYLIYHDIILSKMKWYSERASLLNKMNLLQIYSVSVVSNSERKIILDFYSTFNITKYLANDDLSNFIAAFDKLSR